MCIDQHQRFCVPISVRQHRSFVRQSHITEVLQTFFSEHIKYCPNVQVSLQYRYRSHLTLLLALYPYEHFTYTSF
jgi:hypothetical protein